MLSDEELKKIEAEIEEHDTDSTCLSTQQCCGAYLHGKSLLAEVKRLRQLIDAHDTNGAPECYAIDPPPIKRESR